MTEKNEEQPRKPHRLAPRSLKELAQVGNQPMLVKKLLTTAGMSVIYGDSNTGKTFLALDLAYHIVRGEEWRSLKTQKGVVIYVAAEAGAGISQRFEALRIHNDHEDIPLLYVVAAGIDMCGKKSGDTIALIQQIRQLLEREKLPGVDLIIVDTLARALAGGDENGPADMGRFVKNCDKIREVLGAHVMIVHHSGKNVSAGARGHSSLRAAVDTEIEVVKEGEVISAEVKKQRDGLTGAFFHSELEIVVIGQDEDGEELRSCVIIPAELPEIIEKSPALSRQQQRALDILHNCLAEQGEEREARKGYPPVRSVTEDEFREALKAGRLADTDNPDSVNKAIRRAITDLHDKREITVFDQFIWIPDETDNAGQTE